MFDRPNKPVNGTSDCPEVLYVTAKTSNENDSAELNNTMSNDDVNSELDEAAVEISCGIPNMMMSESKEGFKLRSYFFKELESYD